MRPEADARRILSAVRATTKMHEFRVAKEDFIEFRRDPAVLCSLAVGILGDAAAAIAENFVNSNVSTRPQIGKKMSRKRKTFSLLRHFSTPISRHA